MDFNSRKVWGAKADKVRNATPGHLAGLDSNGNLTDSGVSPTEDVTVEGNPITFDSPFEQDAKSVVVSVKPIQDLHGYDHPWPAGGGKNKCDWNVSTTSDKLSIALSPNTYTISAKSTLSAGNWYFRFTDVNDNYISSPSAVGLNGYAFAESGWIYGGSNSQVVTFTIPSDCKLLEVGKLNADGTIPAQIEVGSTATDFAPYSNICPISGIDEVEIEVSDGESEPHTTTIPLPSTLYDADVDVTEGSGNSTHAIVDLSTLTWTLGSGKRWATSPINTIKSVGDSTVANAYCSTLPIDTKNNITNDESIIALSINSTSQIIARNGSETDPPTGQLVYELATPTTISFTPADVELLEGTNVVTTNGESVKLTYGKSFAQAIDEIETAVAEKLNKSDVADVEGDTASKAYAVNDFMLRSDGLYKVTAPIASGASITSSNTTKTTIGAVLTALLNA